MPDITIDLVTLRRLTPEESLTALIGIIDDQRSTIVDLEAANADLSSRQVLSNVIQKAKDILVQSLKVKIERLELKLALTDDAATQMVEQRDRRIEVLEGALRPLAEAADQVPDGLRATLRIPGEDFVPNMHVHLRATTEHLKHAKLVL